MLFVIDRKVFYFKLEDIVFSSSDIKHSPTPNMQDYKDIDIQVV